MPAQFSSVRSRHDRFELLIHIEAQLMPMVYALICLASIAAAFLRADISWYHPLPAAILMFAARSGRDRLLDMMIGARIDEYEPEMLARSSNPAETHRTLNSIRHRAERTVGGLAFKEMFESPATPSAWLVATAIGFLMIGLHVALIAWCVAGRLTFLPMLGIAVGGSIVMRLLNRLRFNAAFKQAVRRWTAQHLRELEANPEALSALMAANGVTAEQLQDWLSAEITRLYAAGVHPDHFHFAADRPPLEANIAR